MSAGEGAVVTRAALWGSLALVVAFIVYGSLYPFFFLPGVDDVWTRVTTAMTRPRRAGRGDVLANLVLYAPMGLLLVWLLPRRIGWLTRLLIATLLVGLLSLFLEALQAFIPGRSASLLDTALNLASGAAGGVVALVLSRSGASLPRLLPGLRTQPFLVLILTAWLAYRLYPYVPSIDWFEWKQSVRGVILWPDPEWPRSFRLFVAWLVFGWLFQQLTGPGLARWLAPLLVTGTIGASIPLVGRYLSFAEVIAGAAAIIVWMAIPARARIAPVLFVLMAAAIVVERLEPYTFLPEQRPFGWVPFRSLLAGEREVGFQAMMMKAYLYGALLWLGVAAGLSVRAATICGAMLLFATSYAQTWLPGRSAQITDAGLVVLLGVLMALLSPTRPEAPAPVADDPARASPPPPRP